MASYSGEAARWLRQAFLDVVFTYGQREVGTHLGWFLGGHGDWRVVLNGGWLAPIFGDGGRACPAALRLDQDNGQIPLNIL
jgi:hypothetical protein